MTGLKGKFIVLDGGEGCGKSTQAALLGKALEAAGITALLVRDPGSTRVGEMIRAILLDPENPEISMRCEMLLYMAARAQMVRELIAPALDAGKCVISDRFVSSTLAYQLGGDGMTADEIRQVAKVATAGRSPDLTIILDMPLENSERRIVRQRDRIEQRPVEYHRRVRENYLAQAAADRQHVHVIPADRDRQTVHADVMKLISLLK
ncbi:MAG: dTMP kinase [Planctomycetota bacterium]|nr:dTMP kinase [Planctomycetota bacterium]